MRTLDDISHGSEVPRSQEAIRTLSKTADTQFMAHGLHRTKELPTAMTQERALGFSRATGISEHEDMIAVFVLLPDSTGV